MFVKNKLPSPPGCNPLNDEDRMPVLRVVSGDTWTVDADLVAPDGGPASPNNCHVDFVLSENQFSPPMWKGEWFSGVLPDRFRPGLVHVTIPHDFTKTIRRGSYMFSLRVSDRMRYSYDTQLAGNFLVEYMPTSDHGSIPYRDGTSQIFGDQSHEDWDGKPKGDTTLVFNEDTGLYHKVVATKGDDGEVCLGVYQEGLDPKDIPDFYSCKILRAEDAENCLRHRVVAVSDGAYTSLGVSGRGVSR